MTPRRYYGWRPSLPDPRNFTTIVPDTLPIHAEVDPRKTLFPVYNQFQIGSCTANATATVFRNAFIQAGTDPGDFSRLWIYLKERWKEGTPADQDSGAMGHTAYKIARTLGLALETDWEYGDGSGFAGPAPVNAISDALNYRIKSYSHPSQNEATFKRLLSNNQLISFGFSVGSSFESAEVARTGLYIPQHGDRIVGGHEVVLVGYIPYGDGTEYPLFRNSWGSEWGMGGYFCAPWSFVLSSLCSDFRTVDPF